jgi:diacylglycerol O-acyltransferase / wax synthase
MEPRLSPLDASFLRLETESAHMHVGWCSMLELPPGRESLDSDLLRDRIMARIHHAPRFRQRVASRPLGEPAWVDDPSFDIAEHIEIANHTIATESQVEGLTDAYLSRQLDRSRPLWGILLIPRVAGGRAAVIGKVHHAMVDGVAAVELGMLLFDPSPEVDARGAQAIWRPKPPPSPVKLAVDSVADTAVEQFRTARRVASLGLSPGRSLRVAQTMRRAAFSLAEDAIRPAPPSFLNRPIGSRRTLTTRQLPFERLRRLKESSGAKLNDVVLAGVAGAMRRLSALVEEEPAPLRVMVPVNVRGNGDDPAGGNRITLGFIELPAEEADPVARLVLIRRQTAELKQPDRIAGSEALLRYMGQLPGPLKSRAASLAASPRMSNLTVSNIPGPRFPLFAAGALVRTIYPVIPISEGHSLSVGVLSYEGNLHFSAYADPDALPEAGELGSLLPAAFTELGKALERRPPASRSRPPKARPVTSRAAA